MIASAVAILNIGDETSTQATLSVLESRDEIEVGVLYGNRLPLVIEADGAQELEAITRWIQDLECVLHVDVVFSSCEV